MEVPPAAYSFSLGARIPALVQDGTRSPAPAGRANGRRPEPELDGPNAADAQWTASHVRGQATEEDVSVCYNICPRTVQLWSRDPAVVAASGASDVGAGTNFRGRLPDRPELPLRIALPAFPLIGWRCSDKDRPVGPFLPVDRPGPGGLKGRGTLDEPGRSRRPAPRARESEALPVTQAPQGAMRPRSVVQKDGSASRLSSSRESIALSNDSEFRKSRVPRAFWTPESLFEHYQLGSGNY